MKQKLNILLLLLLSLIGVHSVSAQIVDAQGQYVDTVFNDNVDRTAEDFVIASLLVADPGTVLYSVVGHACIRLQCPAFGLDYCFSYESEYSNQRVLDFLAGKLMMGLFAIPLDEYCDVYREDGRGVYEYKINIPIETRRELWRILDEQIKKGNKLPYDYYHRGCAITALDFIKESLGNQLIEFDSSIYNNNQSAREKYFAHTHPSMWVRFFCVFIVGGNADFVHKTDRQLIVPIDLVHALQKATINGEPLLASEPTILLEGKPLVNDGWFTPMVLAIILLIMSIVNIFWSRPYFDWLILVAQTIIGCGMTYLIFFSNLCCTEWNWLIIPFNPLPAICWKWRKYWALPYSGVLVIWCVAMIILTICEHAFVDWSHIVLVISFTVCLLKQTNTISHIVGQYVKKFDV